jgi:epsilon-lactone hydrolase
MPRASFLSHVFSAVMLLGRFKKPFTNPSIFRERIDEERRTVDHAPPKSLSKRCRVDRVLIENAPTYTLSPRLEESAGGYAGLHILYLHGGCYTFEISPWHYRFCASLVEMLGCRVTIPIYPLAPEHQFEAALKMVAAVYGDICMKADNDPRRLAIMGDSAGGGMALALALSESLAAKRTLPKDILLLSPWVDISMSNPDVDSFDARDPWLSKPGLIEAGKMYAGPDIDPKDWRVSPLFGDLTTLADRSAVTTFIGTRDLLYPDAKLLHDRLTKAGAVSTLFEYDRMAHDFMLIDLLPEAKQALADIESILRLETPSPPLVV